MASKGEGVEMKIAIPITEEQVLSAHFALCDCSRFFTLGTMSHWIKISASRLLTNQVRFQDG